MSAGTIVEFAPISVRYVISDRSLPISEQAPAAISKLESMVLSLRGRKFYGLVQHGAYHACVAANFDDPDSELPKDSLVIPGGRYLCSRLTGFLDEPAKIANLAEEMVNRSDFDPSRPVVEYYRGHDELSLRVPVR